MKSSGHIEPSYGDADPIAALATPLGESALSLVRTSGGGRAGASSEGNPGPGAIELLARVFSRPEKLVAAPANSLLHGWIVEGQKKIDEVVVSVFRAPGSYTGEDAADISCHGGIAVVKAVMAALKKAGFREALPGEFTFRSFMNGKLDLTRAESVMELVAAKTGRCREQAVRRLSGALEKEVSAIKALLVNVLAGIEIYLDYSEDEFSVSSDDESKGRLPQRRLAEEAARRLGTLAELWRRERIYTEGALAVLAGRPNAGKSSLFNYLIREDRSIVTDAPGTTRDWIEAVICVDDIPLRLADTAGLRGLSQGDEAERIGMQRSLELLDRADLVLYVIDGTEGITDADRKFLFSRKEAAQDKPLILLWNKTDLSPLSAASVDELQGKQASGERCINSPGDLLAVSAKTGEGIPALMRSITNLLEKESSGITGEAAGDNAIAPGAIRQKELIDEALASVTEALSLANNDEPLDIIAPLFQSAINALGEITGEVFTEDILEAMFSRFCVGK